MAHRGHFVHHGLGTMDVRELWAASASNANPSGLRQGNALGKVDVKVQSQANVQLQPGINVSHKPRLALL